MSCRCLTGSGSAVHYLREKVDRKGVLVSMSGLELGGPLMFLKLRGFQAAGFEERKSAQLI